MGLVKVKNRTHLSRWQQLEFKCCFQRFLLYDESFSPSAQRSGWVYQQWGKIGSSCWKCSFFHLAPQVCSPVTTIEAAHIKSKKECVREFAYCDMQLDSMIPVDGFPLHHTNHMGKCCSFEQYGVWTHHQAIFPKNTFNSSWRHESILQTVFGIGFIA